MPGPGPAAEPLYVSAKVAKTMLAVVRPFGFPARFADPGGAQTRYAQTLRAFFPVSVALLSPTTRPRKTAENEWTDAMTKNTENVTLPLENCYIFGHTQ